ncbi:MAG: hypothetical protein HFG32_00095 [Eubacterium sp.]|jgi:hypothetical protein|nr:hypothetical protein [Eubacterium sp.]
MKEEKKELIAEILGEISDEYIEESVIGLERKRAGLAGLVQRKRWIAVAAACLCLITVILFLWDLRFFTEDGGRSGGGKVAVQETDPPQRGVSIPELEVDLNSSDSDCLVIPFVIYKGGVYLGDVCASVVQEDLRLDTYLGEATGWINGWTEDDGYVDFAGSSTGKLYSVEGLDDSFAVALKYDYDESRTELLVKNTGITLEDASDLYEDRLHLKENYVSVEYQDGDDMAAGAEKKKLLDASFENKASELIDSLCNGEIMLRDSMSVTMQISEDTEFVLFFHLNNRVVIPLYFMRGGYVVYPGIADVCVKIPEEVQEEMHRLAGAAGAGSGSSKSADGVGQGEKDGENTSGVDNVIIGDGDMSVSITVDGKENEEVTLWWQKVLELGKGRTCEAFLCSRPDASKPFVIIRETNSGKKNGKKDAQQISLGNSKDLWYHDLAHSELVAEQDFDGDGTKEILVLINEWRTLAEFRVLKRDSKGKWRVLAQPEGMVNVSDSHRFIKIKVNDDGTALLKVPSVGFQKKLDFSDQPELSHYFAEQGKHAIVDLSFVSVEWTESELTFIFRIYAENAGNEMGMLKQDVVWDKKKKCLRMGRTWYEEKVWKGEG